MENTGWGINESNEILVNDGSLEALLAVSIEEKKKPINPNTLFQGEMDEISKLHIYMSTLEWERLMIFAKTLFLVTFEHIKKSSDSHPLWGFIQSSINHACGLIQLLLNDHKIVNRNSGMAQENKKLREQIKSIQKVVNCDEIISQPSY